MDFANPQQSWGGRIRTSDWLIQSSSSVPMSRQCDKRAGTYTECLSNSLATGSARTTGLAACCPERTSIGAIISSTAGRL